MDILLHSQAIIESHMKSSNYFEDIKNIEDKTIKDIL